MSNEETLQEYNTRLAENNTSLDDILDAVNNLPEGGSSGGSSDIYSLEEVKTNKVWIDGKPIYRKVVDYGPLPNNDTVTVNHNIKDIGRIVQFSGVAVRYDNDTLYIPYVTFNELNMGGILIYMTNETIGIRTTNDRSKYSAYIIVEYTKSTD